MALILSRGLALAPVAATGINGDNPLIGWRNLVTVANVSADGEDDAFPVSNVANPSTALRWVGAAASEQHLTVAIPDGEDFDYVGVARHNFGSARIPVSIEILPEGEVTWTEVVGDHLFADDTPLIFRLEAQVGGSVRIRMQAGEAAPSVAVMFVGRLLVVQRRIYVGHTPIHMGRTRTVVNGRSEGGAYLGSIVTGEQLSSSAEFRNLTPNWFRTYMLPFTTNGKGTPFFFAWRPASYPRETGYVWLTGDPVPVNQRSNGMMSVGLDYDGTVA
jgi:hypothetical protein